MRDLSDVQPAQLHFVALSGQHKTHAPQNGKFHRIPMEFPISPDQQLDPEHIRTSGRQIYWVAYDGVLKHPVHLQLLG